MVSPDCSLLWFPAAFSISFAFGKLFIQLIDFIEDPAVCKMRLLRLLPPSKNITDRK